jgi:AraC-like DNA-binding protein
MPTFGIQNPIAGHCMHRILLGRRLRFSDARNSMNNFGFVNGTSSQSAAWSKFKARSGNTLEADIGWAMTNGRDQSKSNHQPSSTLSTVEIFPLDAVRRRAIKSPGLAAETIQSVRNVRVEYRFRGPVHLLVIYEEGTRCEGQTLVEGLPPAKLQRFAHKLTFVPAGYQYHESHELRTLSRLTYFYIETTKFKPDDQTGIPNVSLTPRVYFEDESLWHTALKLADLVEHPAHGDQLYLEALGIVIVYQLLRLQEHMHGGQPWARGGLSGWQQRIATGYIEEHFAEPIRLSTLAELVHQSPFHFCRAFKQSFGVPPLRYQTKRRIERAKLLLAQPAMSVTDVGLAVGFCCSSSFATAFRKATGFTPTEYQRSLR